MNQCVPSGDLHDVMSMDPMIPLRARFDPNDPLFYTLAYDLAELTWENGQIAMHLLGQPRVPGQKNDDEMGPGLGPLHEPPLWDDPGGSSGTLEAIVDQAARLFPSQPPPPEPVSLVSHVDEHVPPGHSMSLAHMASSSEVALSDTFAAITDLELNGFFTEKDSSGVIFTGDANSSGGHSRLQREDSTTRPGQRSCDNRDEKSKRKQNNIGNKSPNSAKRSRTTETHNLYERVSVSSSDFWRTVKRRDKITQRIKALQMLVPNSNKTDMASMLDEVIEYMKQLQALLHLMNRINVSAVAASATVSDADDESEWHVHGHGMGMDMDMARHNMAGMGQVMQPNPFMQMHPWDGPVGPGFIDPLALFLASQALQPVTPEAYCRMVAMYQQIRQQLGPRHKC